jgi:hypothetical protein
MSSSHRGNCNDCPPCDDPTPPCDCPACSTGCLEDLSCSSMEIEGATDTMELGTDNIAGSLETTIATTTPNLTSAGSCGSDESVVVPICFGIVDLRDMAGDGYQGALYIYPKAGGQWLRWRVGLFGDTAPPGPFKVRLALYTGDFELSSTADWDCDGAELTETLSRCLEHPSSPGTPATIDVAATFEACP